MRRFAPCTFVVWIACIAAQGPTGPSLPRLMQLGPMRANATRLDLRSDGSLTRSNGGTVDLDELGRILASTTSAAELVLAIDRNTACAVVGAIVDLAMAKNITRVHFAAALPDGRPGCFTLALPEANKPETTIDLALHHERTGVPGESCTPLLQRLRRGAESGKHPPFVLGFTVPGDEPFESMLQTLGAVADAGCQRVVLRCVPTTAQQQAASNLTAIAAAAPATALRAPAFDLGPSPRIHVLPRELPHAEPAVRGTAFGCGERAPASARRDPIGYWDFVPLNGHGERVVEAIRRARNWLLQQQRSDGSIVDDAGKPDVEADALLLSMALDAGSTLDLGAQTDALRVGTGWWLARQRDDGCLADPGPDAVRHHALATRVLAETADRPNGALLRGSVEDALAWLFAERQPDGGWNDGTRGAPSDTISTALCIEAIAAADSASFPVAVQPAAIGAWFDTVTEPTGVHRLTAAMLKDHATQATATAAALFARFLCGQDPEHVPLMRASADVLLTIADPRDPWCCYWTSRALSCIGGRHATEWQKRLDPLVVFQQIRRENQRGYWEAASGCSRPTTTALRALTLQLVR